MKIHPVQALIPKKELINQIVTLGPGKLSPTELSAIANANELSYLRVVNPTLANQDIQIESDQYFNESLKQFNYLIDNQFLIEKNDSFFYYKQIHHSGHIFNGWIVAIDVNEYKKGRIKRHEKTIKRKSNKLEKHIETLKSMAEPVLLTFQLPADLTNLYAEISNSNDPEVSFLDQLGNTHQYWSVSDSLHEEIIINSFGIMESLYIADGHHRIAAISQYLLKHPEYNDHEGIMSLVIDSRQLLIKPFYRLLKGVEIDNLIEKLINLNLFIRSIGETEIFTEINKGEVLCLTKTDNFIISLPENDPSHNAIQKLDVSKIEKLVFNDLFNILDTSVDHRVSFLRGDRNVSDILQLIHQNEIDAAFVFAANDFSDIKEVADAELNMPPKTTFIEPKLPVGLLIEQYR